MQITQIVQVLEKYAPLAYQEAYDNAGLIVGQAYWECTGILCTLDATEAVILEAKAAGCNLVVAHHPIIFSGLKKINGSNYVEQTIITAIKNDIAIYAIHTNLDNVLNGVNDQIANKPDVPAGRERQRPFRRVGARQLPLHHQRPRDHRLSPD